MHLGVFANRIVQATSEVLSRGDIGGFAERVRERGVYAHVEAESGSRQRMAVVVGVVNGGQAGRGGVALGWPILEVQRFRRDRPESGQVAIVAAEETAEEEAGRLVESVVLDFVGNPADHGGDGLLPREGVHPGPVYVGLIQHDVQLAQVRGQLSASSGGLGGEVGRQRRGSGRGVLLRVPGGAASDDGRRHDSSSHRVE